MTPHETEVQQEAADAFAVLVARMEALDDCPGAGEVREIGGWVASDPDLSEAFAADVERAANDPNGDELVDVLGDLAEEYNEAVGFGNGDEVIDP